MSKAVGIWSHFELSAWLNITFDKVHIRQQFWGPNTREANFSSQARQASKQTKSSPHCAPLCEIKFTKNKAFAAWRNCFRFAASSGGWQAASVCHIEMFCVPRRRQFIYICHCRLGRGHHHRGGGRRLCRRKFKLFNFCARQQRQANKLNSAGLLALQLVVGCN